MLVFIVSALVHMVLKYHNTDYTRIPDEDAIRSVLRKVAPAPAQYMIPHCAEMKQMETPEMKQKFTEGPVAVINIMHPGVPNMGRPLTYWFLFSLIVSLFIAYVASHSIPAGARYLQVFRIVGAVGISRLCRRSGSPVHLDGQTVEDHLERNVRRIALWTGDGWYLRLALAAVIIPEGRHDNTDHKLHYHCGARSNIPAAAG